MIKYICKTFENGTEVPISLQIGNKIYTYPEDNLFIHLKDMIGEEIKIHKEGYKNTTKIFIIEKYDKIDTIPRIHLINKETYCK